MNRFNLGAIALVALVALVSLVPVAAADPATAPPPTTPLPTVPPATVPPATPEPVTSPLPLMRYGFPWAGFYAGGSAGGMWTNDGITDLGGLNVPLDPSGFKYSLKNAGAIGSGVTGYNFQYLQFVFGIEADLGGIVPGRTMAEPNTFAPLGVTNHLGSGFYSDVTARLGYAFGHALVYAKTGWAFYSGAASVTNYGHFGGGTAAAGSYSGGLTVGGGIEYAFTQAWSVKLEYLHFEFGSKTATLVTPIQGRFGFPNDLAADAVTVGVSYHFGHQE